MRIQSRLSVLLLSIALLASPLATAQYVGPSATPAYKSVADVLKNPVDDAMVTLEGYIVRQVGKKKYMFSDGTSSIRVEIDRKRFPPVPIDDKTKVQIRGEIEKDFLQEPEIDVEYLMVIK